MKQPRLISAKLDKVLFEGSLQTAISDLTKGTAGEGEAPIVTIGLPQCYDLAELAEIENVSLPSTIDSQLRDSRFFLVAVAFSLRPPRNSDVSWARYELRMNTASTEANPLVIDLCPQNLAVEEPGSLEFTLAPTFKFQELEVGLGSAIARLDLSKTKPIVTAYGILESTASWDHEADERYPLRGIRQGYLVVKTEKEFGSLQGEIAVAAEVRSSRGLFRGRTKHGETLSIVLWE